MRLWRWIKRIFKKKETKPVVVETPIPDLSEEGYVRPVVGLVVGHNERDKGARNYLGEQEWTFNSRIANKVQARLNELNIRSVIVFRPRSGGYRHECSSVAKELKGKGCTHAVLLHFNDAQEGAKGVEVLVTRTSTKEDNEFGDVFTDILNEEYGFVERGDDGVKTISSKHGGSGMLNACNGKGIISALVEPCFAGYRTKESILIFESEDKYVLVLTKAIHTTWAKKTKQ